MGAEDLSNTKLRSSSERLQSSRTKSKRWRLISNLAAAWIKASPKFYAILRRMATALENKPEFTASLIIEAVWLMSLESLSSLSTKSPTHLQKTRG